MSTIHAEASQIIDARPEDIYAVLRDYHVGHPAIVPKPYFEKVVIVEGSGTGAGTIIDVYMNVMGQKVMYRETVSEPEPGRVLVEADEKAGLKTTFTVDPVDGGQHAQVTIASDWTRSPGFKGFMESLMNPSIGRSIFTKELAQLADYMKTVQS
jgi:hypothetical protein